MDLDFEMSSAAIEIIVGLVSHDIVALGKWQDVKYGFVKNPKSLLEIQNCQDRSEAARLTLRAWLSEKYCPITLRYLVDTLRNKDLNHLTDELVKHANAIKSANPGVQWKCNGHVVDSICLGLTRCAPNASGRHTELGRLDEKVSEAQARETRGWTVVTNVHGLGGVGKTTLAKMYAFDKYEKFDGNIVWINASSGRLIKDGFVNFIKHVEEGAAETDLVKLSDEELAQRAYKYFEVRKKKCLFVFDDVENFEDFHRFRSSWTPGAGHKPTIIITSRINEKPANNLDNNFLLGEFLEEDAIKFIQENLRSPHVDVDKESAKLLADKLGRHPLALQQAVPVIINDLRGDPNGAIKRYLDAYDMTTKTILSSCRFLTPLEPYKRNVYTTLVITLVKIKGHDSGELAIRLLEYLSFLAANEVIQLDFLMKLVQHRGEMQKALQRSQARADGLLNSLYSMFGRAAAQAAHETDDASFFQALQLLKKFSLVQEPEPSKIEVHRLLQDVVRVTMAAAEEVEILRGMMIFIEAARHDKNLEKQAMLQGDRIANYAKTKLAGQFASLNLNIEADYRRFQEIAKELTNSSKFCVVSLIQNLVTDDRISLAILFLNSSNISISNYLHMRQNIENQQEISESMKTILLSYMNNSLASFYQNTSSFIGLAKYLIKFFSYLDTAISLEFFVALVGKEHSEYSEEQIKLALKELQAHKLIKLASISLDLVVKYGFSLLNSQIDCFDVQKRCVQFIEHCLSENSESAVTVAVTDVMKEEAARHALSIMPTYSDNAKLKEEFPAFAVKVYLFAAQNVLQRRIYEFGYQDAGRQLGFVIGDVLKTLNDNEIERIDPNLLRQLEALQSQLYTDVPGLSLDELQSDAEIESSVGTDSGFRDVSTLSIRSGSTITALELRQSTTVFRTRTAELIRIRDLIIRDPVALKVWGRVVDDIVRSPVERLRIKGILKNGEYPEAVLMTLRLGESHTSLVQLLRRNDLNSLADNISAKLRTVSSGSFGVSRLPHNFCGRESVIETIHKKLENSHSHRSSDANVVSISGLGGVGKSAVAQKYAITYRQFYGGNIIWITGETVDSMRASFIRLTKALGLQLGDQPSNTRLVEKLLAHFQNKKCLLIFDNVEEKSAYRQFLPHIWNPNHEMPYVLVTSRRTDLNPLPGNEIRLDVLTPEEAVEFIQTQLLRATSASAVKLAEKLQGLPLALQQAVAYIRDTYVDGDDEAILEYLKEFEKSEAKLLNDERFRDHNDYSSTTLATWQNTLTRIRELDDGEFAIEVIRALAYLNPDLISVKFVRTIFKEEAGRGLRLLERFSMISVNDGKVAIHRLVQHVVRLSFRAWAENEIQTLVMAIRRQLVEHGDELRLNDVNRECTSHGLHLFPFQMTHRHSAAMATNRYFLDLCSYLMEFGNYAGALSISQQMAFLYQSVYGDLHESTIGMKLTMAYAYSCLGWFSDSLPILNSILPTAKFVLGTEHWLTVGIQAKLATDLSLTGANKEALQIYDEILPVAERVYGENNNAVLVYKAEKAKALRRLGKLDEALELLQHVHDKRVSLHGENGFRTFLDKFQIAAVHYDKKEFSRALEMWKEVETAWRLALGDDHPETVQVQKNIAACMAELAKRERQNCQML